MFLRIKVMILLTTALSVCNVLSAEDDPLMGIWKINLSKSTFGVGLPPKMYIRKHDPIPNGIRLIRASIEADGRAQFAEYTVKFDGKEYPTKGDPLVTSIWYKRPNPHTVIAESYKDGKVVNSARWDLAKDGKSFTWTATRKSPPELDGKVVVQFFEKQE